MEVPFTRRNHTLAFHATRPFVAGIAAVLMT